MKRLLIVITICVFLISCQKNDAQKELKTAYIDTSILMKEYIEAQDLQSKYKAKAEEKGKQLEVEVNRFKKDAANFQREAQLYGQAWAQQKGAELQQRDQQLRGSQQALAQQLQEQSAQEMDTLVSKIKKSIAEYGKKEGYSYIYGTGDAATVLYAEEKYNITNQVVKLLNDNYKSSANKDKK